MNIKMEQLISIFFSILIILFALGSFYFLYVNDFSKETLPIVFPTIGAIIFSVWLGVNSTLVNAPSAEQSDHVLIVLHSRKSGDLIGLGAPPKSAYNINPFAPFRGMAYLGHYRNYNKFKDLKVWDTLKVTSENEIGAANKLIFDLVEFAILHWLTQSDLHFAYFESTRVMLVSGGSGSSGFRQDGVTKQISLKKDDWNPFVKEWKPAIALPKGSKLTRTNEDHEISPARRISIRTPHSNIDIHILDGGGSDFSSAADELAVRVRKVLGFTNNSADLWQQGILVRIETSQTSWKRYSNQARLESEWMSRLRSKFHEEFSWDDLKKYWVQ